MINIYASHYAQKVLDFNRTVIARSAEGWLVRGAGAVRELRAPAALGVPHMAESVAIAGFQPRGAELYVHLVAGDALLRFTHAPQREPRLVEANGHLENWRREGSGIQFALRGHAPLRFALANVSGCRVESAGTALNATTKGDTAHYALAQHGIDRISITCPP